MKNEKYEILISLIFVEWAGLQNRTVCPSKQKFRVPWSVPLRLRHALESRGSLYNDCAMLARILCQIQKQHARRPCGSPRYLQRSCLYVHKFDRVSALESYVVNNFAPVHSRSRARRRTRAMKNLCQLNSGSLLLRIDLRTFLAPYVCSFLNSKNTPMIDGYRCMITYRPISDWMS